MTKKSSSRILAVIFATLLLDTIGFGIVIPIIPGLFTDVNSPGFLLGAYSVSQQLLLAGLITALYGLMQFIAAPILGELSDVYGRKRLLTIGVGVLALSQMLFGLGIEIGSLYLLFFARSLAGLAAANISIAQAAIADITEPKDRAKNFGLIGAAFGLGFIIGPLIAGWTTSYFGNPAIAFWIASLLGLINMVFISLFLTETNQQRSIKQKFTFLKGIKNIKIALQDVDARPLYVTSFLYLSGFAFFTSFVGILLINHYGFNEAGVGTFFAFVGICIVITQGGIVRILAPRYTEQQIIKVTMICVAITIALYPFMPSTAWLYILVPFLSVPQGLTMANLPALISKSVSPAKQGAALGINGSMMALAQGVVPLTAGLIAASVGIQYTFLTGAMCVFSAWLVMFVFMRR
ncbi:MAG: hypothetical protein RLZZ230_270 [Candidatus Parcubacteria bacterium]|jgi:MFS family permease